MYIERVGESSFSSEYTILVTQMLPQLVGWPTALAVHQTDYQITRSTRMEGPIR